MRLQAWTSALAVVLSTAPAYAQPSAATPTAYFSMGSTIQSITLATNGSPSPALVYSGPTRIGDLALCADGELYFVEPDLSRISRVRAWGGSGIAEVVVQTSGSIGVPGVSGRCCGPSAVSVSCTVQTRCSPVSTSKNPVRSKPRARQS